MRLFFAINFPPLLRQELHDLSTDLRRAAPSISWVPQERLHLTVRFLGATGEESVDALRTAADEVAGRFAAFPISLGSAGAFPNLRRPRVVWIGVAPDPKLELLHHELELGLQALGYETEGRPFRPHVTVGRSRGRETEVELARLRAAAGTTNLTLESAVNALDLMQSTPSSPEIGYRCLHSAELRS
jgi:RNA 2',3'-cyclic 3'-phosphodiesterase